MLYRFISFPIIIEVGTNILNDLISIFHNNNLHFNKPLILTGEKSHNIIMEYSFFTEYDKHIIPRNINNNYLVNLRNKIIKNKYDVLIASGGGRIIDLGKYLASQVLIPVVSIPTLLSSDAISSPISVIRINNRYRSLGTVMPIAVIIDITIIKNSPVEFTLAGLGELISNISASYDWQLANKEIGEKIDRIALALSYLPAINILESFHMFNGLKDENFLKELAVGLVLSGIAMNIAHSSRPASGSEHNISHALDKVLGPNRKHHGLQVGFATIFTTYLQKQVDKYNKIIRLYRSIGFPLNLNEIGISKEEFIEALKIAPYIRDRYTILNKYKIEDLIRNIEIIE